MNDKTLLSAVAVLVLGLLESVAMLTGNDGAYFVLIASGIAGLAGYSLGQQENIKALGLAATSSPTCDKPPAGPASS